MSTNGKNPSGETPAELMIKAEMLARDGFTYLEFVSNIFKNLTIADIDPKVVLQICCLLAQTHVQAGIYHLLLADQNRKEDG